MFTGCLYYLMGSWYFLGRMLEEENTGSRVFTEVKPCWTGLISEWVTILMKYPVLYSLGSQAGAVDINHAFTSTTMLYVDRVSVMSQNWIPV